MRVYKPELLSPAGSLDKLKVAVSYGADAVYLAGQKFGLRTAAENFTHDELDEGIAFAHAHGVKVFVVINSFLHDSDMLELSEFVGKITELKADATIVSDLGVIRAIQKSSKIPIHLSTQASCLNRYSGQFWKRAGVSRLILGREVSIEDAGRIKRETGLEVELFIHGSMCMAYSGHCTISSFTRGRDSNRGGCAQSCRFHYDLNYADGKCVPGETFMSSKDLNGIELLPFFFEQKIDSLKIEGRMRSPLYAGLISKVYRDAIDAYENLGTLPPGKVREWSQEMALIPHRDYTSANLMEPAGTGTVYHGRHESQQLENLFIGVIRKVEKDKYILVEVRNGFNSRDALETISFRGENATLAADAKEILIRSSLGAPLERANPNMLVRLPYSARAQVGQIIRRREVECV